MRRTLRCLNGEKLPYFDNISDFTLQGEAYFQKDVSVISDNLVFVVIVDRLILNASAFGELIS